MAKLQFYSRLKVSSKLTSTPSPAGKDSVGTELSGKCSCSHGPFPCGHMEKPEAEKGAEIISAS